MGGAAGCLQILKIPPQAPRANAICERLIGTLRRESLDQVLVLNERHLRQILMEYAGHYNDHRPHQSRDQRPPNAEAAVIRPITNPADLSSVRRQPIIGGVIHQYRRAA